jgi:hypothetical protein
MHKERSAQMLPITTNIAETHEALNAVKMLRISSSQEHLLLIHASEKYMEMFPCKPTYSTLVPLMCFRLTGHSNQHQVLPPTIHNSWNQQRPPSATCIFLTGQ